MKIESQQQPSQPTREIQIDSKYYVRSSENPIVSHLQKTSNTQKKLTLKLDLLEQKKDDKYFTLKTILENVKSRLKPSGDNDPRYFSEEKKVINRFKNIPSKVETRVGNGLHANNITIDNKKVAIATQYPLAEQMGDFFKMIVQQKTSVIVVLASKGEIDNPDNNMHNYFSRSHDYGDVSTDSNDPVAYELVDNIKVDAYDLLIQSQDNIFSVKVHHVNNWPDHGSISTEATGQLVDSIKNAQEENEGVPVIHCRAGVGRTGVVLCALAMNKDVSVERAIVEARECRNGHIVQNNDQMDCLIKMAVAKRWPVLKKEEPGGKTQPRISGLLINIQSAEGKSECAVPSQVVYHTLKKTPLNDHANNGGSQSSSLEAKELLTKPASLANNHTITHNDQKILRIKSPPENNCIDNEVLKIFESLTPVVNFLATESELKSAGAIGEFFLPGVRWCGDIKIDSKESDYSLYTDCLKLYDVNMIKVNDSVKISVIHFYKFKNGVTPENKDIKELAELNDELLKRNIERFKAEGRQGLEDPNMLIPIVFRVQGKSAKSLTTALIDLKKDNDLAQK